MQLNTCSREWEALQEAVATLDVLACFAAFSAAAEGPTCRATFVPHGAPCAPTCTTLRRIHAESVTDCYSSLCGTRLQ